MKTKAILFLAVIGISTFSSCEKETVIEAIFDTNDVVSLSCDDLTTLNSLAGTPSLNIRFENRSSKALKVEWIHFNGDLVVYDEELPVSEDYFIQSFQFHYWYITDEDGNCIGIYHAGNLLETNVITFQDK